MSGYFNLLVFFVLAAVTLLSAMYYVSKYLGSRMRLQDLQIYSKPHRQLTPVEKQYLLGEFEALEKICKDLGAPLIPNKDEVYVISGPAKGFGLESMATKLQHTTIDGIPVEFPAGLSDYLHEEQNVAEVAISKRNAVVLSLNGVFIDPPSPENFSTELLAALQSLMPHSPATLAQR